MPSERERGSAREPPQKPHRSILEAEIVQAEEELQRPAHGLFVSGILAGLGVGTSLFLMAVVVSGASGELEPPVVELLRANAFTVGFILVVQSRVDLFTEYTTIAILPVLVGRAKVGGLLRLWGLVYAGNMLGALAFAALTVALGPALDVIEPRAFGELAEPLTRHGPGVTFTSGLLAGWLMGVLSWLIAASRDTTSQVLLVWIVTFAIGLGGLHHSITGAAEVFAAWIAGQGTSLSELGGFLVWTTLGNAAGGVLFALLIRYSLVVRDSGDEAHRSEDAARAAREPGSSEPKP